MEEKSMKASTLLIGTNGVRKLNEGDLAIALQCTRIEKGKDIYQLDVNMDWSFDDATTPEEIKNFIGGFLGSVEDVFGEKMVTEAIMHYAHENNHIIHTPDGPLMHLKSKGLSFKKIKK